jgi:MFS family permease
MQAGMMVGPAIGGLLADSFGIRAPFFVVGLSIAAVAVNNHLRLNETKPAPPASVPKLAVLKVATFASQVSSFYFILF